MNLLKTKKRIVAEVTDSYVNIPGDRLEYDKEHEVFFAYNGDEIVGVFDINAVMKIYISEVKA